MCSAYSVVQLMDIQKDSLGMHSLHALQWCHKFTLLPLDTRISYYCLLLLVMMIMIQQKEIELFPVSSVGLITGSFSA